MVCILILILVLAHGRRANDVQRQDAIENLENELEASCTPRHSTAFAHNISSISNGAAQ